MTKPLRFFKAGRWLELGNVPPHQTLLSVLRDQLDCKDTKEACAEGDCGACTVVIADMTPTGLRKRAVNACIAMAHSVHDQAVITSADLGTPDQPHPVHQSLCEHHASQCGFCTPGIAMSLVALQHRVTRGETPLTRPQVQETLSGNLCRCTGYRPVVDAALALAPHQDPSDTAITEALNAVTPAAWDCSAHYALPTTAAQALQYRHAHPHAQVIAGATDVGLWVTKGLQQFERVLDLSRVRDWGGVTRGAHSLTLGASVRLQEAWAALTALHPTLEDLARRFAGRPVRNAGTLVGNIANGSPIGDAMPVLLALDARLTLARWDAPTGRVVNRELPLSAFYLGYRQTALQADELIAAVTIPIHATDPAQPGSGQLLRAYKVSKRQEDDISAVCLAVSLQLEAGVVRHARIGLGGVAATPARGTEAEQVLLGQAWTLASASAAGQALQQQFQPISDMRASSAYRSGLLLGLMQRAWHNSQTPDAPAPEATQPPTNDASPPLTATASTNPVGQPLRHESAMAQCLGLAPYADDLVENKGTLYAAPILSPVAHGRLLNLNSAALLQLPGVVAVVEAEDIPGDPVLAAFTHDEPVLVRDEINHLGQVLGLVVASDMASARRAAQQARPEIETLPAILDVDTAMAQSSYVLPPVTVNRGDSAMGLARARHQLQGHFEVGGQEHFYLEGQIAIATPQEQRTWHITSSTQHPGEVQHWVAHALGLEQHRVTVSSRRMGGGFGGKETQAGHVAVWAALAAHKTGRPVKLRLDRDDDFMVTGKRHPFAYRYTVGFDDEGRVTGLDLTLMANCGHCADLSGPVVDRAVFHADNAYFLSDVTLRSYRLKTHTQSHTAFRGFGGPQGVIAIETILGDIARHLGLDPLAVRLRNLYGSIERNTTPYGMVVEDNVLPELLARMRQFADYDARRSAISQWNRQHPQQPRGLAITPVKFGISFTATQFNQAGALVHVYADGSIQVNHGGTEMGQGLNTKVAQIVAHALGVAYPRVQVTASDTSKVPNASATAASSGTDLNGKAAEAAALQVRDRLIAWAAGHWGCAPEAVHLADDHVVGPNHRMGFAAYVHGAYRDRVQLWSDGFYKTPKIHYDPKTLTGRPFFYFAYGAACSEVAIDPLTGEYRVVRVDIVHDVGQSINPAIDIGQIEGGFVQGMGWLTTEELVWDGQGRLRTHAPSTYKIPTSADVPEAFHIELWTDPNREDTVHRSKAVGEPPFMLAISVWEALRDAVAQTRPDGRVHMDAPATPERVWQALRAPLD